MNLLALVEAPDHVCCRYRIRAFAPALEAAGWVLTCVGLERGWTARIRQFRRAAQYEAVVLQRKLLPGWQLGILRRTARRLVFDFDDAVLYRDSNDPRGPHCPRRLRRFVQTVRACDAVIAGNDFLADCALRAGARADQVHVVPTCIEPERASLADHDEPEGHVDLVWIGTSSTLWGLEEARGTWDALEAAFPRLRIRVICDRFPHQFPVPVVAVHWSKADEARQLAAGHIGVSVLPDDLWSLGKCGLKVLQYQAAGLPVIANPVGQQREMVRSGANGILASTPDDWVSAVARLVDDPPLRRRMGAAGRHDVEAGYSVSVWADAFVTSATGSTRPVGAGPEALPPSGDDRWPPRANAQGVLAPHFGKNPRPLGLDWDLADKQ